MLKRSTFYRIIFSLLICMAGCGVFAQGGIIRGIGNRVPGIGGSGSGAGGDSLKIRNQLEDSITIRFYFLDSSGARKLDSSINDFTRRFPIPATHVYLGNTGVATRSILFEPNTTEGFDPGFHALDVYKWKLEQIRFYNTTRPYTELDYQVGTRSEQIIEVLHTQNIRPYWNFSLRYRAIASTGFFRNERSNHNNYLFTSWYQAPKKRYNNYFIVLYNKLQAEENGGVVNDSNLTDPSYIGNQYQVPTKIGGAPVYSNNFFSSAIYTGHRYRELSVLMRQQYDLGKKDSIVTDSTVIPLFYPRLRFEHTLKIGHYSYSYLDNPITAGTIINKPDSAFYWDNYNKLPLRPGDSLLLMDSWREINNDFSIYQFPDAHNLQQFIKLGADLQLLKGTFHDSAARQSTASLYNVMLHGEYRNRTRNQKWDMLAYGHLYLNGYNSGNYHGYISLERLLSPNIGTLQIGFENINRSPSFDYDRRSAFYLDAPKSFGKENTVHFFASAIQPKSGVHLGADYFLITNYMYLTGYYQLQQESAPFNLLRINAMKTFRLGRHWNWYAEAYVQQTTGPAPVHIPLLFTRNRIMYEGNLGFKNLNIAFGLEGRYNTPYKADNYSPVPGQFSLQDSSTISNRPDVSLFLHFRIRGFKAYIRAENLNTARFGTGGFHFVNNNFAAPGYPTPDFMIRFGIYWSFVN